MLPIHTILFPTDLSEEAQYAFPFACSLARDCGAHVVVLYVVPPPVGNDQLLMHRNPEEYYEGPWEAIRQMAAPEQNVLVEHRLADGDAAKEILKVAEEIQAGMIVMSTHGRTGLGRLLFGSVAEKILRSASCPVLFLKKPAGGEISSKPH